MATQLFHIYSDNTSKSKQTSQTTIGSFPTTSEDFYSINFDTNRGSIWTHNVEFGRGADWDLITGKPDFSLSDHTHTWSDITDKPATATRWPTWSEVTSKPDFDSLYVKKSGDTMTGVLYAPGIQGMNTNNDSYWGINTVGDASFISLTANGNTYIYGTLTAYNNIYAESTAYFKDRIISSLTDAAPFIVQSTYLVSNLNADMLDGKHASEFLTEHQSLEGVVMLEGEQTIKGAKSFSTAPSFTASGAPFTVTSKTVVTNLNADLLDGKDASYFLSEHQKLYNLTFAAGKFTAGKYAPGTADKTINIPTKVSELEQDVEYVTDLSGVVMLEGEQTIKGAKTFTASNIFSTAPSFTSATVPFTVTSKNVVTNLNADLLDGKHYDDIIKDTDAKYVTLSTAQTISAKKTFSTQQAFTVADGTAPFTVTSKTAVTNLNADMLDGKHASEFLTEHQSLEGVVMLAGEQTITGAKTFSASNIFSAAPSFTVTDAAPFTVASKVLVANLNADLLDGKEASYFLSAHQTIYKLTFSAGKFTAGDYTPNTAAKTINIPTKVSDLEQDVEYVTDLSGVVMLEGEQTINGAKTFTAANIFSTAPSFTSTTVPFTVTSKNVVTNLNADLLDGKHYDDIIKDTDAKYVTLSTDQPISGKKTFNVQQAFTVADGTAPFTVTSKTAVTNLNADMLDGKHASEFLTEHQSLAGVVMLEGEQTIKGAKTFTASNIFSAAPSFTVTDAAPFTVASSYVVTNFNADMLDGKHASYFLSAHQNIYKLTFAAGKFAAGEFDPKTANKTINIPSKVSDLEQDIEYVTDLSGVVMLKGEQTIEGAKTFTASNVFSTAPSFTSTTVPFIVTSRNVVANLNADLLDGKEASYFLSEHQKLYKLTFAAGKFTAGEYEPGVALKTINIPTKVSDLNVDIEYVKNLDGVVMIAGEQTITGTKSFSATPAFTATGTNVAPFTVASSYVVANLNADMLDGKHASYFLSSHQTIYKLTFAAGKFAAGEFDPKTANKTINIPSKVSDLEQDIEYVTDLSGVVMLDGEQTITGAKTFTASNVFSTAPSFTSTTVPFTVTSKNVVTNLNADLLDGKHYDDIIKDTDAKYVTLTTAQTISGKKTFSAQQAFTVSTANTAPFTVTSSYVVTNLNADMLDGKHASEFLTEHQSLADVVMLAGEQTITGAKTFTASNVFSTAPSFTSTTVPFTVTSKNVVTNLNADLLDGKEASYFLSSHQNIYKLTFTEGKFTAGEFDPKTANKTINIPTKVSDLNVDIEYVKNLDGVVMIAGEQTISGAKTFSAAPKFTVADGAAPFTVASSYVVANLNADMLDGKHASYFLSTHQTIYKLTFAAGKFTAGDYTPNTAAKTINIPTKVSDLEQDVEYVTDLSGVVMLKGEQTIEGAKTFTASNVFSVAPSFTSTTVPFTVTSRNVVTNLNADLLDGKEASYFLSAHQSIYKLTFAAGKFTAGEFDPKTANKTINVPTKASDLEMDIEYVKNLDGVVMLKGEQTIDGAKTFTASNVFSTAPSFTSTTVPFTVTSRNVVANLNADLLDGKEASYFLSSHQAIYKLTFAAGKFAAGEFDPKSANKTINIPTKVSELEQDIEYVTDLSGVVMLDGAQTIKGAKTFTASNVFSAAPSFTATGTNVAPFTVASSYVVANLNADMLDGKHASYFLSEHQKLYKLTFAAGKFTAGEYEPGVAVKTINIPTKVSDLNVDIEYVKNLDGVVMIAGDQTITGAKSFSTAPAFTASGTPFTVTSKTVVANLNADLLDGLEASAFLRTHQTIYKLTFAAGKFAAGEFDPKTANKTINIPTKVSDLEQDVEYVTDLSGVVMLDGEQTIKGAKTFTAANIFSTAPSFTSTTVPFTVTSKNVVANLNADLLDGLEASAFLRTHQTIYKLTFAAGKFTAGEFDAKTAAKTINIPTKASHIEMDIEYVKNLDGVVMVAGEQTITGAKTFSASNVFSAAPSFTSTTVPFTVTSKNVVANLNADLLDGKEASYFLSAHQTIYKLTFAAGKFAAGEFDPKTANKTINVPTKVSDLEQDVEYVTDLSGVVMLDGEQTITGAKTFTASNVFSVAPKFTATGTNVAPFTVTSSYVVANLNADTVDGKHYADIIKDTDAKYVTLSTAQTISGKKTFSVQQAFTVADGTAPFTVTSKTAVTNLNADMLDGKHASDFLTEHQSLSNVVMLTGEQTITGAKSFSAAPKFTVATGTAPFTVTSTTYVPNLNADMLDGKHASYFLSAHQTIYKLTFAAGKFVAGEFDPKTAAKTINIPTKVSDLEQDVEYVTDLSGVVMLKGEQIIEGAKTFSASNIFSAAPSFTSATVPFTVTSKNVVTNLNADMLDGKHASDFLTAHQSLADYVTLNTAQTISAKKTFSVQQAFTVADGTAPFTVTSKTAVTNLNADMLDGKHASDFLTAHQSLDNYVTLNTAQTISGKKTFSTQQAFTVATGTSPFTVNSTTAVTNLNADMLDGYHRNNLYASSADWFNATGKTVSITVEGSSTYFYPVVISVSADKARPTFISIWKNLGSATPSITGNHSNGTSSLWLQYEMRSTKYDGNGGYCHTLYKSEPYGKLIAHAEADTKSLGSLILYLRGGTCQYNISCTNTFTVDIYYSDTNIGTASSPTNVVIKTEVDNGGIFNESFKLYGTASKAVDADTLDGKHASAFLTEHQSLANYVTLGTAQTISAKKTFSVQQAFTVADGTAPFTVTSKTAVTNLNADMLDGKHASDFLTTHQNIYKLTFAEGKFVAGEFDPKTANKTINIPTKVSDLNVDIEYVKNLDGVVMIAGDQTITGGKSFSAAPKFTIASGQPFTVASKTVVTNLNADLLDGKHYDDIIKDTDAKYVSLTTAQTISGKKTFSVQQAFTVADGTAPFTVTSKTAVTNLNADMLDGKHASDFLTEHQSLSGVVMLAGEQTITGAKTFSAAAKFTVAPSFTATGAPFTVTSKTVVANLNADLLDGMEASAFLTAHQNIYALTFAAGKFTAGTYTPNSAAKTINIPTKASHLEMDIEYVQNLNGVVMIEGEQTITGVKSFSAAPKFTVSSGQPFTVTSKTAVTNLNADLLDGIHAADLFTDFSYASDSLSITIGGTKKSVTIKSVLTWADITGKPASKTAWGQTYVDANSAFQSISGNMTGVGNVTPDGNGTRDNGSASARWANVYGRSLKSDDNLVLDAGTGKPIIFRPNNGTETVRFLSDGKVGIGTTAPTAMLGISKGATDSLLGINASSFVIGNFIKGIHLQVGQGSGATVTDGYTNAITFGSSDTVAHAGIYVQSSGSYGTRMIFGTTNAYASGAIGRMIISNTGSVGINTMSPSYKLHVMGDAGINNRIVINTTGQITPYSTSTRRAGMYGIYDSSKIGHIWSMGAAYMIDDDGATFGNLYGFAYKHVNNTTGGTMAGDHQAVWCVNGNPRVAIGNNVWTSGGFIKNGSSDSYVLTGNGGHKQWSESAVASTIVARTASNYIYATYFYSDIANDDSQSIGSVYVSNTSDKFIRKVSLSKFATAIGASGVIEIEKSLNVTEAWMDTGITLNTTTFPEGTGTYAVQVYVSDSASASYAGYYPNYSGIMSIYTGSSNSTNSDEIPLHACGHAISGKRIYLRTIEQASSYNKIQIAASANIGATLKYVFKFKKLI